MFCVICQNDVFFCKCPDIEERLQALSQHPNFALSWCQKCDRHVDRCECRKQ